MREIKSAFYSISEAAKIYGESTRSFRRKIAQGVINPPIRYEGDGPKPRLKFPVKKFDEWIESMGEPITIDVRRPEKFRKAS